MTTPATTTSTAVTTTAATAQASTTAATPSRTVAAAATPAHTAAAAAYGPSIELILSLLSPLAFSCFCNSGSHFTLLLLHLPLRR